MTKSRLDRFADKIESLALWTRSLGAPKRGTWLAVIDDSHCTVRMGGPGHLWQFDRHSGKPGYWHVKGVGSPYSSGMFRRATPEEIAAKEAS